MSNNIFKSLALFAGLAISLGILVVGVLSLRSYFTQASGTTEPKNIRTANVTASGATAVWETEKETQGIVRYATDPAAFSSGNNSGLLYMAETAAVTKHEVKLTMLKADTTYYFEIAIGKDIYDQSGQVKDNKHLPFTFTTVKEAREETAQTPTLDGATFREKFGSTDPLYDLNKDGIVNSTDYLIYLSRSNSPTP